MSHSIKLKKLFGSLHVLLHNESYNISEAELQNLLELIRLNANRSNISYESIAPKMSVMDCGGAFTEVAKTYADFYHPYFAMVVCMFGSVANVLNIIVLTRKDMACAPINRILTALAVADMVLMIEYIPYAYYYYLVLREKMDFPYPGAVYMLFHAHLTQILHTVSICLTLTLAIWRYLAIGYKIKWHWVNYYFPRSNKNPWKMQVVAPDDTVLQLLQSSKAGYYTYCQGTEPHENGNKLLCTNEYKFPGYGRVRFTTVSYWGKELIKCVRILNNTINGHGAIIKDIDGGVGFYHFNCNLFTQTGYGCDMCKLVNEKLWIVRNRM